jgi:hypothetical protein
MRNKIKRKGILLLKKNDEEREIEFELDYLLSLTVAQRVSLMEKKTKEIRNLLAQNGHRKAFEIIKRKQS